MIAISRYLRYCCVINRRVPDPSLAELADAAVGVVRQLRLPTDPAFIECTPVEISVMRVINRTPGATARMIAEATALPSSNVSRALRGLEERELVRREADPEDARVSHVYPTPRAEASTAALHTTWSETLEGILDADVDPAPTIALLRRIEDALIARRRASTGRGQRTREDELIGPGTEG